MGTRADFYIKTKVSGRDYLTWKGSIGWDGYPEAADLQKLQRTRSTSGFEKQVKALSNREDFTNPNRGWPWPWDDSRTTDYTYVYSAETKRVSIYEFGKPIGYADVIKWPDMTDKQNVTLGKGSGLIVF